jgi:hypothetical protein
VALLALYLLLSVTNWRAMVEVRVSFDDYYFCPQCNTRLSPVALLVLYLLLSVTNWRAMVEVRVSFDV